MPLLAISLIPTFALWMPFLLRLERFWNIPLNNMGMASIVANYDGPLFVVVAKTLYNVEAIKAAFQFPLPVEYYAAHFPLYPLLIRLFSPIFGYPYSMLILTLASSVLALYFFQKFISSYVKQADLMWITLVFALLPARWLIVRSVGSAEPLFVAATIAAIYYFQKKKYLHAGIWGAVAQLTKSAGILLFVAFVAIIVFPKLKLLANSSIPNWVKSFTRKKYPILFIPIALLVVFTIHSFTYGNFFAYFNSGDNIHLFFPPFQIFNYSAPWVGTFWLEEIIFVYLFGILGLLKLIEKKQTILAWFVGVFFVSILFVSHRDLIRYSLPVVPFLLAAWSDTIVSRNFKIAMAVLIIPIYLFSLTYISQNVMPIANWAPFL